ncbi:hypothetical protein Zm00014a_040111 [Zea mays]|nr:hypothetical protein Zm00014a_040111 [Zea mays]
MVIDVSNDESDEEVPQAIPLFPKADGIIPISSDGDECERSNEEDEDSKGLLLESEVAFMDYVREVRY